MTSVCCPDVACPVQALPSQCAVIHQHTAMSYARVSNIIYTRSRASRAWSRLYAMAKRLQSSKQKVETVLLVQYIKLVCYDDCETAVVLQVRTQQTRAQTQHAPQSRRAQACSGRMMEASRSVSPRGCTTPLRMTSSSTSSITNCKGKEILSQAFSW